MVSQNHASKSCKMPHNQQQIAQLVLHSRVGSHLTGPIMDSVMIKPYLEHILNMKHLNTNQTEY